MLYWQDPWACPLEMMELHQPYINAGEIWLLFSICSRECRSKFSRPHMVLLYGMLYHHGISYYLGCMLIKAKGPSMYTATRVNSIPVMTALSGNIVPCLGSDVISNKYGNNGSQCCKLLGDLMGNLIRLCDRFEINPCPHCIYTIYNCLSDGL